MSIEAINEQLLRAIGAGVALLDPGALALRFYNETFGDWFDSAGFGVPVSDLMPDLDAPAIISALELEGVYSCETTFRRKRRTLVVAVTFTRTDSGVVLMECQNITRIRELETMIESYSAMVERNTREIQREKERVEKLLLNIMPRNVYEEYKTFGVVTPQRYEPVSVLTLDFMGFDDAADRIGPAVTVSEVNDIYAAFDRIGEQFGCERIKTVGDAYVCICGLPEPVNDHQRNMVSAAQRFLRYLTRRNGTHDHAWTARIGIASGAVIGSVVGIQKYVYDVFGPAVNLSNRLRDVAGEMEIVTTAATADLLKAEFGSETVGPYDLPGLGEIELKRMLDDV